MLVCFVCFTWDYYIEHAQTLGTVLNRGARADARGAKQVLGRGGQAVVRGSLLGRGA
jgi:hypothetical protein